MTYLLDEDYQILRDAGLEYEEAKISNDNAIIIKHFPLPINTFIEAGKQENGVLTHVDVLTIVPPNYNTGKLDMFWFHPALARIDGASMDRTEVYGGGDPRHHAGKEYCRWSRHDTNNPWRPKEDNLQTWLNRLDWALKHTDCIRG